VGPFLRAPNLNVLLVPRSTSALEHAGDLAAFCWEQTALRYAATYGGQIAAISDHMRTHLNRAYGVPDGVMVDLPNGLLLDDHSAAAMLPVPQLPRRARAGFLLAMGRAVPTKGFEDLLRALGMLRRAGVRLPHLVLAATSMTARPTPHQRQLAELVRAERLDATVLTRFTPDVRSFLASPLLRGVVVPSRSEAFGRIPLEAFAVGAGPVVATRTGGLAQTVLDGTTGFTAEPSDPASLARAIERALRVTAAERDQLLRAGRALLYERHDYQLTIRRYLIKHVPWVLAPTEASDPIGGQR
jgi:glycosyltransferase involved in cell wall biosynthesis